MRRHYAFEAAGVTNEVKAQLEKVEEVVDDKCKTSEDCDKMLEKIEAEEDKFNGALKEMSDAAKSAKGGEIDKAAMAEKITPKMAELKEVAKAIGVAQESDSLTEDDLKNAKAYIEGAKEIVEAKADELKGDDKGEEKSDDKKDEPKDDGTCPDCGKNPCECEGAEESFNIDEEALGDDSLSLAVESALDTTIVDAAMEGANADAIAAMKKHNATIRGLQKELKALKKDGDFKGAANKAREIAKACRDTKAVVDQIPASVGSAVIANVGLLLISAATTGLAGAAMGGVIGGAGGAAVVGGLSAVRGAAGAAGSASGNTLVRLLQKKGVMNGAKDEKSAKVFVANAEDLGKKLDANDFNAIIASIKVDLVKAASDWEMTAKALDNKAAKKDEKATESETLNFDGFVQACEAAMIDKKSGETVATESEKVPYLFG